MSDVLTLDACPQTTDSSCDVVTPQTYTIEMIREEIIETIAAELRHADSVWIADVPAFTSSDQLAALIQEYDYPALCRIHASVHRAHSPFYIESASNAA